MLSKIKIIFYVNLIWSLNSLAQTPNNGVPLERAVNPSTLTNSYFSNSTVDSSLVVKDSSGTININGCTTDSTKKAKSQTCKPKR